MAYLGAMSRQRDPSIDPNLAEAYSARQERLNKQALDLLAEEGAIGARGAERMGDIAAQGIKEIVPAYQAGRRFRNENESHLVRMENSRAQQDRDAAEDAYWNQEMPEDYSVSVPPSQVKPHTVIGGVDFGPQRAPIAPSKPGFSMTDPQFLPQSRAVSSPGAAAVLDGTAPQYGGAVPAPVSARAPAPAPQGNGPMAPSMQGAPQGMPNTSPIPDRTEYLGPMGPAAQPYQMRKMTGGVDFGQAEDAGPPSDFNMAAPPWENQRPKPLTRRQHMLQLQEQKAEEEVKLLREGKGKGTQAVEWQDTGRVTGDGHPIMFNRATGQYKAQPDIMTTAKGGKTGAGVDPSLADLRAAQTEMTKARTEAIKHGKSASGSSSNEWAPTSSVDENGQPIAFNKRTGQYAPMSGIHVKPKVAAEKPPTAAALGAAGYADRAQAASEGYGQLTQSYDPTSVKSAVTGAIDKVPLVGAVFPDQDARKARQFKKDFATAILRKESGAAISQSEFDDVDQIYFPQPGDSPEVVAQKKLSRERKIEGLRYEAGKAAMPKEKVIGGKRYRNIGPNQWQEIKP